MRAISSLRQLLPLKRAGGHREPPSRQSQPPSRSSLWKQHRVSSYKPLPAPGAVTQDHAMRITCPACSAAYEVPEHLLGTPRTLRCAKCNHEWTVLPPTAKTPSAERSGESFAAGAGLEPSEAQPAPEERPTRPDPEAWNTLRQPLGAAPPPLLPPDRNYDDVLTATRRARPRRRASAAVWLGWIVSVAVLAGLGWAACTYRAQISQIWPPSQRAYQALGLADAGSGAKDPGVK
jgi:predicted Zn finger-like uncharacterized protein